MAAVALITGASGLIGRHVLEQWDVDGLRAQAVDRAEQDLLLPGVAAALVGRVRPGLVIHLAWSASGTPGYRDAADNERWVEATLALARACGDAGAALIATGTSLDRTVAPADAYAASKVRLWRELAPAVAAGELAWVRPYYVIDPARRRPALVDHALAAREAGRPVVLRTPESEHDFIHAADVASAIIVAVRAGLRGELAVGSGRLRRVRELVDALGIAWEASPGAVGSGDGRPSQRGRRQQQAARARVGARAHRRAVRLRRRAFVQLRANDTTVCPGPRTPPLVPVVRPGFASRPQPPAGADPIVEVHGGQQDPVRQAPARTPASRGALARRAGASRPRMTVSSTRSPG